MTARRASIRFVRRNAKVIAGLKWPPEIWPSAVTISAMASPWASATPTRSAPRAIAPTPTKISVKAPTNSATARWLQPSGTSPRLGLGPDVGPQVRWLDGRSRTEAGDARDRVPALPQDLSRHAAGRRLASARRLQVPALQALRRLRAGDGRRPATVGPPPPTGLQGACRYAGRGSRSSRP